MLQLVLKCICEIPASSRAVKIHIRICPVKLQTSTKMLLNTKITENVDMSIKKLIVLSSVELDNTILGPRLKARMCV